MVTENRCYCNANGHCQCYQLNDCGCACAGELCDDCPPYSSGCACGGNCSCMTEPVDIDCMDGIE